MTSLNVQLQDPTKTTDLFPKTKGAIVENTDGTSTWNLGGVEANAEVNIIETVKVNGSALTPDANRAVDITIASQSEYTVAKKATAEDGYIASYELKKDGVAVGDVINIPKDYLVKSASMGICETAGTPTTVPALAVGDPYLDFVINTKDGSGTDSHIYINVKGLVDIYTAGTGIDVTSNVITNMGVRAVATGTTNGTIKVNTGGTEAEVAVAGLGTAAYRADTYFALASHNQASNTIDALTGYSKGSSHAALAASDTLNQALSKLENQIDQKADSATTLNGYGITDGVAYVELT